MCNRLLLSVFLKTTLVMSQLFISFVIRSMTSVGYGRNKNNKRCFGGRVLPSFDLNRKIGKRDLGSVKEL